MSGTTTNGRPRKQLSDQLDRLDSILDALAEALPAAVADACREGARAAAVKDAIIEIVANPELRALLAPPAPSQVPMPVPEPLPLPEEEPPRPTMWQKLRAKTVAARDAVAARCKAARETVVAVGTAAGEVLPLRRVLFVGLGVGLATGVFCLLAPHAFAATVGALGAAAVAVGVQVGRWARAAARGLHLIE